MAEVNFWHSQKTVVSCYKFIRECGSILYVELACTAPPTNTNFLLTFLLTRLQQALCEDLSLLRNLKSTISFWPLLHSRSKLLAPAKKCHFFIKFIIIIIIIIFFRLFFSKFTDVIATSLIPLVTNFTEICAFIIVFSFTAWTKMRPLLAH